MRSKELLSRQTVTDLFTVVYVLLDDYLQAAQRLGRFTLPRKRNQRASYAELLTIVLVGEILQQKNQGLWYLTVKSEYQQLFPVLPELSRFYRIQRNFERIYADLALLIAEHDGVYLIDSQPVPICKGVRYRRARAMTEATSGRGGATKQFFGFRLHAVCSGSAAICRFAIVPANEHDVTVARCLLDERYDDLQSLIADKAYLGLGIYTPPKQNAQKPGFWCGFFAKARKSIEAVFSSLTRYRNPCVARTLQQLNSFWSIRASLCRPWERPRIAAHNLLLFLFP
jgi:hypothetical protein